MTGVWLCACMGSLALANLHAQQKPREFKAPETFSANFNVATSEASAAGTATIQIDQYTRDGDREAMLTALKTGDQAAFLKALRAAPRAGLLTVAGKTATIRWARQIPSGTYKRTITVVTDEPVFFAGGALADAKPRAGYDVAVIRFDIDDGGYTANAGTMAAAANIKLDATGNVDIGDYASTPIKLTSVSKKVR
jgi:hypothetical protein